MFAAEERPRRARLASFGTTQFIHAGTPQSRSDQMSGADPTIATVQVEYLLHRIILPGYN
jgi:hypothetical protein